MSKIILDVNDNDLNTVLTILKSLKNGMIKNIQTDNVIQKNIAKPISSSLNGTTNQGKYLSKNTYKEKLTSNKILEDDFLPKKASSGKRYLSPDEYKNRLNRNK